MTTRIHEPGSYCPDRRDEIIDYIFEEMGPGAAEAFESHLASCAGCRDEVATLGETMYALRDVADDVADPAASINGGGVSWNEEWTLLRRRLIFAEVFPQGGAAPAPQGKMRSWILRAAGLILAMGLTFTAGYNFRGNGAAESEPASASVMHPAPPVSGAAAGNYFDNLDDFTRDTHNFLRRTRMLLMEFTNLGADSDPMFFREAAKDLMGEVEAYRAVASRMKDRKLNELLDQIAGILEAIGTVSQNNQARVIADVKASLDLTGLVATLEILDAAIERDLQGQPNV